MAFELWETSSRNLAGVYDTEADALTDVRTAIEAHGHDYVVTFTLVRVGRRGDAKTIATGDALAARALEAARQPASRAQ